jgi:hypothetical protein
MWRATDAPQERKMIMMFEEPTKTAEERYNEFVESLRAAKNQPKTDVFPQGTPPPADASEKTAKKKYDEYVEGLRASINGDPFPFRWEGKPPLSQKARTSVRNLRMEVLLALYVLGEGGPTKLSKLIGEWRQQPVGRNWVGDHLKKLRKQGYVLGSKRKLKHTVEHRYVNSHVYASYSLTDKGRRETEELVRWMQSVGGSVNKRISDDIFA